MKNKFLNLIALVLMAICFSTFTMAKTNDFPANADKINFIQTENAPTATPATSGIFLNDIVGVNAGRQNENSIFKSTTSTNGETKSIQNLNNYFNGGTRIELHDVERIQRMNNKPDNLYISSTRATNFRLPNEVTYLRLSIDKRPDERILKRTFDAVNRLTIRR